MKAEKNLKNKKAAIAKDTEIDEYQIKNQDNNER